MNFDPERNHKNKQSCLKLWRWVAVTGRDKEDYFIDNKIPYSDWPKSSCYACAEALARDRRYDYCEDCPIKWGVKFCLANGSVYLRWLQAERGSGSQKELTNKIVKLIEETWEDDFR